MRQFKYMLRKGSKKERCPACGKFKCFVPYVLATDGTTQAGPSFGRCERINSCGYIKYPEGKDSGLNGPYLPGKTHVLIKHDTIPIDDVNCFLVTPSLSNFGQWLISMFGDTIATLAFRRYKIGTYRDATIFWQISKDNECRTGKLMYYDMNGKREKNRPPQYLHKKFKPDFELRQVFFGEHLIKDKSRPVCLVEGEKTAVVMSILYPDKIWLATGGAMMINADRLSRLHRLDEVYPDNGCRHRWTEQTKLFNPKVDTSVDNAVAKGIIKPGSDILDLYIYDRKHD